VSLSWTKSPAALAVAAAASYRLTRLWLTDDFPPVRAVQRPLIAALAKHEERHRGKPHPLAPLLDCPWCVGFWISAGVVLASSVPGLATAWRPISTALALSTAVGFLSKHDQ
jgi:hypothetical protein